jgi:hypothetical protein
VISALGWSVPRGRDWHEINNAAARGCVIWPFSERVFV